MASANPLLAQAPATRKPATQAKPQPKKPAAPTVKPAVTPPEPAPPPAPPPPQDVHFKATYTTGDQKTEAVTFVKDARERFEFQDMVLLKQHDEKRIVQISLAAHTYYVTPENPPGIPETAVVTTAPGAPPRLPGAVTVTTTIVDTGERKPLFGQQARHVKTVIERQPMPGACDMSKPRVETDGWYIDTPKVFETQALSSPTTAAVPSSCADVITANHNGDPKALGFPVAYTTTVIGDDGKASVVAMEVSEFEVTTLEAALFEIPQGMNAALNLGELAKAVSNANEAKLAAENAAPPVAPVARKPGVIRIGVPELTNKTDQTVDTRTLRSELITNLTEAKFEVVPLATAPQAELQQRATERGLDYLLLAEVSELKVPKGGVGGMVRAASRVGSSGAAQKEPTEASLAVKLLQLDGKQRLSTTAKGKDSTLFSAQTGIGLARLATSIGFMMGPGMMLRMYNLNGLAGTNLGGMGLLGNPTLFRAQAMTMAGMGAGRGSIDQTAGAASFIVQQAMAMRSSASSGSPDGPSFDQALNEALDNASKAVVKALEKK